MSEYDNEIHLAFVDVHGSKGLHLTVWALHGTHTNESEAQHGLIALVDEAPLRYLLHV